MMIPLRSDFVAKNDLMLSGIILCLYIYKT